VWAAAGVVRGSVHEFEGSDMHRPISRLSAHGRRSALLLLAAVAGFGTAALVGVALAKTFTLQIAGNATVAPMGGASTHANIVVNSRGQAVYYLTGDSKRHPKCTKKNGCFKFWPPVKVPSAKKLSKVRGIKGKLGVWHRNGFFQIMLDGHPLYTFDFDHQKRVATGEGVKGFNGTWHVRTASGAVVPSTSAGTPSAPTTTTMPTGTTNPGTTTSGTSTSDTTTTMPTTTTTPCLYPPCY
jgi:predicted lipoprotein with Yx(FWY)xxD motif